MTPPTIPRNFLASIDVSKQYNHVGLRYIGMTR